jgi:acetoin utilization deacetylase AcuC-like enzyme
MDRVRHYLSSGIRVVPVNEPASVAQLELAHHRNYVRAIIEGLSDNGFGNRDSRVTDQARACVGAMIQAVHLAVAEDTTVGVPCSGFHHAGHISNWGFCTFNGLVISILEERAKYAGWLKNVLIIDGDGHAGDGTETCIMANSIEGITHLTGDGLHHEHWADTIGLALRAKPWDLVLYQAGADAHREDPYGVGYLSDDDWFHRDTMIFDYCAKLRIPLVFNFAGGYAGEQTVDLHFRTVRAAAKSLLRYGPAPTKLQAAN